MSCQKCTIESSHSTDDEIDEVEFADQRKSGIQEVGDGASRELSTCRAQDGGKYFDRFTTTVQFQGILVLEREIFVVTTVSKKY